MVIKLNEQQVVQLIVIVCVYYSLKADGCRDGVEDCICMRQVRKATSLDAFKVHGLEADKHIFIISTIIYLFVTNILTKKGVLDTCY